MELARYLAALRRGWRVIALFAVVGAVAGYAYASSQAPQYRSTAAVFFQVTGADNAGSLLQGSSFAQSQVRSYAALATQPLVLDPVIDQLKMDVSAMELARQIEAVIPLDTVIVEITATAGGAEEARAIADAVATELETTVEQLSRPDSDPEATATVNAEIVGRPTAASYPFSPNTRRTALLGLIAGLGLGAAVSIVRELLNTRIPDEAALATVTDLPLLGKVPMVGSRLQPQPIPTQNRSQVEAYRRLAANLDFVNHAGSVRVLVVTSANAGEGKSTVAANIAHVLSETRKVLLIDGDLRNPSLADRLGLEPSAGLTTVIAGKAEMRQIIQHSGRTLDVMSSGVHPPNPTAMINSEAFAEVLAQARRDYELVIIDGAPLLPVTDSALLAKVADGALLAVRSTKTTRTQLARAIDHLRIAGAPVHGVVLTMTPMPSAASGYYGYYGETTSAAEVAHDHI